MSTQINQRFIDVDTTATAGALTDNSGGTASATLAAISATYVQAEVRNSVASLAAQINALIADVAAIRTKLEDGQA